MLKKLLGLLLLATTAQAQYNVPANFPPSKLLFERDITKPGYTYVPAGIVTSNRAQIWYCGSDSKHPADHIMYRNAKTIDGPFGIAGKNTYEVALAPNKANPNTFDHTHACDPSVVKVGDKFYMYYGGAAQRPDGTQTYPGRYVTEIGIASSTDGRKWTRVNQGRSMLRSHPSINSISGNLYGTGQPSAVFVGGYTYIFYTDTVSPASNNTNGAGTYVVRSTDPTFFNGTQAYTTDGWISIPNTGNAEPLEIYLKRVSKPVAHVVSTDVQYNPTLNKFLMGVHGIAKTLETVVLNADNFNIEWVGKTLYDTQNADGPGFFRGANGWSVLGSGNAVDGIVPIRSIHAATNTDVFGTKLRVSNGILSWGQGIPGPIPPPVVTPAPTACKKKTIPGYDVLGLAMYCDVFLRAPKLPALSTLMNTFGDPLPCVKRRLAMGGMQVVQVDLIDATCWRNSNCAPGVPRPDDLKIIQKRAAQVRELALLYPDVHFEVSPGLEHDVKSVNTVTSMLKSAKLGCPECEPVNSPFSGATPSGYRVERHGTKVTAELVSSDGASMFDADNICKDGNKFQHRLSGDETESWINEFNLRCTGEDNFTPPLQRTNKPTDWQFLMIHKIMTTEEDAIPRTPTKCRSIRAFSKGEINKPTAEFYCNGVPDDGRGNKPLLILKRAGKRGQKFDVYDSNGKVVGCYAYYGPYTVSGFHRWYMGSCSRQTPWDLYRRLGQEWGFADMGNGQCLRFNSLRRENVYR